MTLTDQAMGHLPRCVADPDDGTLRTWLGGLLDQVQPTADLLAAPAVLGDPTTAPMGMLPWMAAVGGIDITGIRDAHLRAWMRDRPAAARGSLAAIRARVTPTLQVSRWVGIECPYLGSPHRIRVTTYAAETPDPAATAAAAAAEVPAWMVLTVRVIAGLTYDQLAAKYPTYDAMQATGKTYDELAQETT